MTSPLYMQGLDFLSRGVLENAQKSFLSSFETDEAESRKALIHFLHLQDKNRN